MNFDYKTYDRQLTNLLKMSEVMLDGWEDYQVMELNCDLRSLRTKAARLCAMADMDAALQLDDLMHSRAQHNEHYLELFRAMVHERLKPHISHVVDSLRQGTMVIRVKGEMMTTEMSQLLPQLVALLPPDECQRDEWDKLTVSVSELETEFMKKCTPAKFPGMQIPERMMYLLQYFVLMCYLLFLFQRMEARTHEDITEEEAARRLLQFIQQYGESEAGAQSMRLYQKSLRYENGERPLTAQQMRQKQCSLHLLVPESLRLCFMDHIHDLPALASTLVQSDAKEEDALALVDAVSKWQWLNEEIYAIEHPAPTQPKIFNRVICTQLHDRPVDLVRLRDHLKEHVIPLIKKKNHWFALWCVLRHRSLLQSKNDAAFAEQMMHPDWFAYTPSYLHFNDATLRTYNGYLSTIDYCRWDEEEFMLQASRLGKQKKWNLKLFRSLHSLCEDIDEEMEGYGF